MKKKQLLLLLTILATIKCQNCFSVIEIENNTGQRIAFTIKREFGQEVLYPTTLENENITTPPIRYINNEGGRIVCLTIVYYHQSSGRRINEQVRPRLLVLVKKDQEITDNTRYTIWMRDRQLECAMTRLEN